VQLAGPVAVAADVTHAAAAQLHLVPGREVWAAVKASETHAYPADLVTVEAGPTGTDKSEMK
jgi:molybdate transport system ATP-binding protein